MISRVPLLASWTVTALLVSSSAGAQDEDEETPSTTTLESHRRSLADRIPAVSGRVFAKQGRLEVAPAAGISLNDPFFRHIPVGGSLTFHVLEAVSIGASGEYYLSSANRVPVAGGGKNATPKYNRPSYAARLDISWAPLYGKLSLMAETVLHFDTYVTIAAGVVGPTKTSPTFAWGFALGQHYVVNQWLAIKVELRDQFFQLAKNPDVDKQKELQSLLTVAVGLCFYLPTEVERGGI